MADDDITSLQQQKNKTQREIINSSSTPILTDVDPNYLDLMEQCESLRRSNLQLREEILIIDNENNDLKKKKKKETKENSKQRSTSMNREENFKKQITKNKHHKGKYYDFLKVFFKKNQCYYISEFYFYFCVVGMLIMMKVRNIYLSREKKPHFFTI